MAKKIVLIAEFNNPLHADDAISNLIEADFKPKQTKKNGTIVILIPVDEDTKEAAKEILTGAQADSISQKPPNKQSLKIN